MRSRVRRMQGAPPPGLTPVPDRRVLPPRRRWRAPYAAHARSPVSHNCVLHELAEWERTVLPGWDEEVLTVGRGQNLIEPETERAHLEGEPCPVGKHPVHRRPNSAKVIARRVEHDEMEARCRRVDKPIRFRVDRPVKRVV